MKRCYLLILISATLSNGPCNADFAYNFTLNTSGLISSPAGPFSLAFQLTDGSFVGDGNNTVELSKVEFAGGGLSGPATEVGGVTGDLSSFATLTDNTFFSYLIQPFNPGVTLSFGISGTSNVDAGGGVDNFSFSILDNTGQQLPTYGGDIAPFFDVFLNIDFDSPNPTISVFASDPTRTPAGGGSPISTGLPELTPVPEGSTPTLISAAVALLGILKLKKHYLREFKRSTTSVHRAPCV